MKFPSPLLRGQLIRRYKRFFADIVLENGQSVVAHCPNTGAMLGVNTPGSEVWVSRSNNPRRKLQYTWELVRVGDHLVGINTQHPNRIVSEAIEQGQIPELSGYATLRREVRYGKNSRIDILLTDDNRPDCYVEIKNVHLNRQPGLAEFPDAVSTRAAKHQDELATQVDAGARAVTLYLCQRQDCEAFRVASDIDQAYASAAAKAAGRGVERIALGCILSPEEIVLGQPLNIED